MGGAIQVAYYENSVGDFVGDDENAILGALAQRHGIALEHQQKSAWLTQIRLLQTSLARIDEGHILFEFSISRMGKRADVVLVLGGIVFVLEFKVGATSFDRSAVEQVQDYALDLNNFHRDSNLVPIIEHSTSAGRDSICFATGAGEGGRPPLPLDEHVVPPRAPAVYADPDVIRRQHTGERRSRELRALIGVEDLWLIPRQHL